MNSKTIRSTISLAAAAMIAGSALLHSATPASAKPLFDADGGDFTAGPGFGLAQAMGKMMTAGIGDINSELAGIQASMAEIVAIIESQRTEAGGEQQQSEQHGFTCSGCYLAAIDHESDGDRLYIRNGTTYTYDFETDSWSQDGDATPSDLSDTDGDGHQDDADDGSDDPFGAEDGDEDDDGRQDLEDEGSTDPDGDGRQGIWDGAGCGGGFGQTCGVEIPTNPVNARPAQATVSGAPTPSISTNPVPTAHLPGKVTGVTSPALNTTNLVPNAMQSNIKSVVLAPTTPVLQ